MAPSDSRRDVVLDTLAFTTVERLLVHIKHAVPPSDADWNCWVAQLCRPDHDAVLVTGSKDSSAPSSTQRARCMSALDAAGRRQVPLALIAHSVLHRGALTAFRWLAGERGTLIRAFPPEALDEALVWLGVAVRREDVENAIERLQSALVRPAKTTRAR